MINKIQLCIVLHAQFTNNRGFKSELWNPVLYGKNPVLHETVHYFPNSFDLFIGRNFFDSDFRWLNYIVNFGYITDECDAILTMIMLVMINWCWYDDRRHIQVQTDRQERAHTANKFSQWNSVRRKLVCTSTALSSRTQDGTPVLPHHRQITATLYLYTCVSVHLCTCTPVYLDTCVLVHLCTCTCVYLYTCVPVHLCTCAPVYLYTCVLVHMCTCTPVYLYTCVSVHLCTYTPVYLYTCVPVHLCTCTPVYLYTCVPVHLFTCTPVLPHHSQVTATLYLCTCVSVHMCTCTPVLPKHPQNASAPPQISKSVSWRNFSPNHHGT